MVADVLYIKTITTLSYIGLPVCLLVLEGFEHFSADQSGRLASYPAGSIEDHLKGLFATGFNSEMCSNFHVLFFFTDKYKNATLTSPGLTGHL